MALLFILVAITFIALEDAEVVIGWMRYGRWVVPVVRDVVCWLFPRFNGFSWLGVDELSGWISEWPLPIAVLIAALFAALSTFWLGKLLSGNARWR